MRTTLTAILLALVVATAACQRSGGDPSNFPNRPVTLVVGYSPGGTVDTAARGIQPYLQKALGASVIVENKPGSNALIAANYVAGARPDGYTLMIGTNATIMNSQVYPDSWISDKSFIDSFLPIYAWVSADGNGIAVKKASPFHSMEDLAAEARKRPIKLCMAGGLGSGDHVTALMIRKAYGGEWIVVPMDSGAEATAAVEAPSALRTCSSSVGPDVTGTEVLQMAAGVPEPNPRDA